MNCHSTSWPDCCDSAIRMSILILAALALLVIPLTGLDMFASDIETCKHVSASLGSIVIPASERESPLCSYQRHKLSCAESTFSIVIKHKGVDYGY